MLIAVAYFQISNPRLLIPDFPRSMVALALVTGIALLVDRRRVVLPRVPWASALYLGLCAVSVLWSITPADTVRMTLLYAWIALFAGICAAQADTGTLLRGFAWGGVLVVLATLISLLVDPIRFGHGLLYSGTALGVHGHRGIVAYSVVLALTAALMRRPETKRSRAEAYLTIAVNVVGVAIAPAATGQVGAACVLVGWLTILFLRRLRGRSLALGWATVAAALVLGGIAALLNRGRLLALLGKSPDFTGRFGIWEIVVGTSLQAPLTGYGFGAVWRYSWWPLDGSDVLRKMWSERTGAYAGQPFFHGHNLLIDVLPQLGLLGATAAFLVLGLLAVRGISGLTSDSPAPAWGLLIFLALVTMGLAEPLLSIPLGWFCATVAAAAARAGRVREFRAEPIQ